MDWVCWWYNHTALVVSSSTVLAFLTNISEKCKSTSPSTIQVKNQQKTISNEEKLDIISQLEQGKQPVHICHIVSLGGSSVRTIHDSSDRIKKVLSQELKCLCSKTTTDLSELTMPKHMDVSLLHFYCIRNK